MKARYWYIIAMIIVIVISIWGINKKQSYTDITKNEKYLDELYVAELPENIAEATCTEMKNKLPSAENIVRITPIEDVEFLFLLGRQKVRIEEVYQGDVLKTGDEIYLYSDHWCMSLVGEYASVSRGFINVMDTDREYLAFMAGQLEDLNTEIPVYQLYDDFVIAPVFCYEEIENIAVETEGNTTYVPYSLVKENEFFGETDDVIEQWEELKRKMVQAYPR